MKYIYKEEVIKETEYTIEGCICCSDNISVGYCSGSYGYYPGSVHISCEKCGLKLSIEDKDHMGEEYMIIKVIDKWNRLMNKKKEIK